MKYEEHQINLNIENEVFLESIYKRYLLIQIQIPNFLTVFKYVLLFRIIHILFFEQKKRLKNTVQGPGIRKNLSVFKSYTRIVFNSYTF